MENVMVWVIVAVLAVVVIMVYFNRDAKSLDINKDGKVDMKDLKAAAKKTEAGVKKTVKRGRGRPRSKKPAAKK